MLITKAAVISFCLLVLILCLSICHGDDGRQQQQQQEKQQPFNGNTQIQRFIAALEELVLDTTDRALIVTKNVYLNLTTKMPVALRNCTQDLMLDYIQNVEHVLGTKANYTEKRRMLKQFKANNEYIERLRKKKAPEQVPFEFQLISDAFYNEGKNCTEFDGLYLEFMQRFESISRDLWKNLSERTVEEQEELLEILDEISAEKDLREKDKLYDAFIEIYLFRAANYDEESKELI